MNKKGYVYIITNQLNGTLYIGVTSNLQKRIWEHKEGVFEGFSKTHGLKNVVWYEVHDDIAEAIKREKAMKKWNRKWKLRVIDEFNPDWDDLYGQL